MGIPRFVSRACLALLLASAFASASDHARRRPRALAPTPVRETVEAVDDMDPMPLFRDIEAVQIVTGWEPGRPLSLEVTVAGNAVKCLALPVSRTPIADNQCRFSLVSAGACDPGPGEVGTIRINGWTPAFARVISKKALGPNAARRQNPPPGRGSAEFNYADSASLVVIDTACEWLPQTPALPLPTFGSAGKPLFSWDGNVFAVAPDGSRATLKPSGPGWRFDGNPSLPAGTPIVLADGSLVGWVSHAVGNQLEIDPHALAWVRDALRITERPAPEPTATTLPAPPPAPTVPPSPPSPGDAVRFGHVVSRQCLTCHVAPGKAPPFPSFLTRGNEWEKKLGDPSDPDHHAALEWLDKLEARVVHSSGMLDLAKQKLGASFTHEDAADQGFLKGFVEKLRRARAPESPGKKVFLTPPDKQSLYQQIVDSLDVEDPALRNQLREFDMLYDHSKGGGLPHAHQLGNDPLVGVSTDIGIRELGDPNAFFSVPIGAILDKSGQWLPPYRTGVGSAPGNGVFFLVRLPRDAQGNPIPIASWRERLRSPFGITKPDDFETERHSFPVGTMVAEVRYTIGPDGKPFVHDILTRKKSVEADGSTFWDPDRLTPYPSLDSLRQKIHGLPGRETHPGLQAIDRQLASGGVEARISTPIGKLFDDGSGRKTDTLVGKRIELGTLDRPTFETLFRGSPLRSAKGLSAFGLSGGPFPNDYHVGAVAVNKVSCRSCHENFGRPFRELNPSSAFLTVTYAYGNLSGGDGIGSFYPQDPAMLNQFMKVGDNRRLNPKLNGLVVPGGRPTSPQYRMVTP